MFQLTRERWRGFSAQGSTSPDFPKYLYYNFFFWGSIFPERYPSLPIIYLGNLVNSIDSEVCQCNSVLDFQLFWPQSGVDKSTVLDSLWVENLAI